MEFYPEGMNAELDRQFTTPEALRRAMMQGSVLESRVLLCDREHNLHVDLGAMRGIIPREEGAVGIDDGTVRVRVDSTFPLADAAAAHERAAGGHIQGKIVLVVA